MMIEDNEIQMHSFLKQFNEDHLSQKLLVKAFMRYIVWQYRATLKKIYVSRTIREFLADFLGKIYLFISMKAIIDFTNLDKYYYFKYYYFIC